MQNHKMKNKSAQALGQLGGTARAKKLTGKRRSEIAAMGGKAKARAVRKNGEKGGRPKGK